MPTVNITDTEVNPTYVAGSGGGRKEFSDTEITPTYEYGYGGGRKILTETEQNPLWETDPPPFVMGLPPGIVDIILH